MATEAATLSSLYTALGFFGAIAALLLVVFVNSWNRKNYSATDPLTLSMLVEWTAMASHVASKVLFCLLALLSIWWFFGLKAFGTALVSSADIVKFFNLLFYIILATSAFFVLFSLYRQCSAIYFFMDWEKSRGKLNNASNEEQEKPAPVSAWRLIMMTNEFTRLQIFRRISVEWTLIFAFFLSSGLNLRALSYSNASWTLQSSGSPNPFLLFATNCLLWLACILVQSLYRQLVHIRQFGHALYTFVDLLSLSNLSVFILDHRFHGYYLHGRSVHPFADTDLPDMISNLEREQNDMVAKRGLEGTDQQTFELVVSSSFRRTFDKIYALLRANPTQLTSKKAAMMSQRTNLSSMTGIAPEQLSKPYEGINKLLCNYVDNNLKEHKHITRKPTVMERLTGASTTGNEGSEFLADQSLIFGKTILFGLELDMLLLYFMIYTSIDIYLNNPTSALIITYSAEVLLRSARYYFGRRNIVTTTMFDSRFLLD